MLHEAQPTESIGVLTKSEHLGRLLEAKLGDGEFTAGHKFLSTHDIVRQYGVSPGTARKALGALVQKGYLQSRHGAGHFLNNRKSKSYKSRPERHVAASTALLVIVGSTGDWGTGVLDQYVAALERACERHDWQVFRVNNRADEINQAIEGIKLAGCLAYSLDEPPAAPIDPATIINWGSQWRDPASSIMGIDRESASRQAHEHLWDLGHERTAMLQPASWGMDWFKRSGSLLGMRKAYAALGQPWSLDDVMRVHPQELPGLYERICGRGITGIYCEDWKITAELYRQAHQLGQTMGQRLALVTSGGNDLADMVQPRAARVYWRSSDYAALVVRALRGLEDDRPLPRTLTVPMFLEPGPSAQPLRAMEIESRNSTGTA
jgi:DNA-binding LacI/PurR family transcriptional regulator